MRKISQENSSEITSASPGAGNLAEDDFDIEDTARLRALNPDLCPHDLAAENEDCLDHDVSGPAGPAQHPRMDQQLSAEIIQLKARIQDLQSEAQRLSENQAVAEADLAEARRQLEVSERQRHTAERFARQLKLKLRPSAPEHDQEAAPFDQVLASARQDADEHRRRCRELESRLQQARRTVQALETYINHRAEYWRESRQEMLSLRQRLRKAARIQARHRRTEGRLENRLARALRNLHRTRRRGRRHAGSLGHLQSQTASLEQATSQLSTQYSQTVENLGTLEQQASQQEKALAEQTEALASLETNLEQLTDQLAVSRSTAEDSGAEAERLRRRWAEDRDGLMRKIHRHDRDLSEATASVESLSAELADREKEMKALENWRTRLSNQMSVTAAVGESLHHENRRRGQLLDAARHAYERQMAQTNTLEQKLGSAERQLSETEQQLNIKKEVLQTTQDQLTDSAQREIAAARELARRDRLEDRLRQQLCDVRQQRDALSQELSAQVDRVTRLETELDSRRRSIAAIRRNVSRLATLTPRSAEAQNDSHALSGSSRMLVSVSGSPVTRFPLFKDRVVLGRDEGADILLDSEFASRTHARILNFGTGAIIEDLGSRNGTLVNNQRVRRRHLQNGDLVAIGELRYRFVDLAGRTRGQLN